MRCICGCRAIAWTCAALVAAGSLGGAAAEKQAAWPEAMLAARAALKQANARGKERDRRLKDICSQLERGFPIQWDWMRQDHGLDVRKWLDGGGAEIEDADLAATRKLAAQHLLLDWENVDDDDGKPLAFDRAYVMKLAEDPAYTLMFDDIVIMANEQEAYRQQAVEDAAGN